MDIWSCGYNSVANVKHTKVKKCFSMLFIWHNEIDEIQISLM